MEYGIQPSALVPRKTCLEFIKRFRVCSAGKQKGVTALLTIIIILAVISIIISGITLTILNNLKSGQNIELSLKSYYAAESGIEDILLRANPASEMQLPSVNPSVLSVEGATATRNVGNIIGGTRTISSEDNLKNRIRKINAVYAIATDQIAFHYGAQVGNGGLKMSSNSAIHGNVFSNGSILPEGSGRGSIDNDAYVAYNGNRIEGVDIGGDGHAHTFKDCSVIGKIYYVSGGSTTNCSAGGGMQIQPNQIDPLPMPISDSQILSWKNDAALGGTIGTIDTNSNTSLGPIKIEGDLRIYGNAELTVTGTIWVTGDVTFENNAEIRLNSSYGSASGMIIADGRVLLKNNAELHGSGLAGSYIMVLTTNNSVSETSPAFWVLNNTEGDVIFYSSAGLMILENNTELREATAYKLFLKNNVEVTYETGLESAAFSGGPSGGWEVKEWKETI